MILKFDFLSKINKENLNMSHWTDDAPSFTTSGGVEIARIRKFLQNEKKKANNYYETGYAFHQKENYEQAKRYYDWAISSGENVPEALNKYALLYRDGTGVEKDRVKALDMFEMAYNLGNPKGLLNLMDSMKIKNLAKYYVDNKEILHKENERLQEENVRLKEENAKLKQENSYYKAPRI